MKHIENNTVFKVKDNIQGYAIKECLLKYLNPKLPKYKDIIDNIKLMKFIPSAIKHIDVYYGIVGGDFMITDIDTIIMWEKHHLTPIHIATIEEYKNSNAEYPKKMYVWNKDVKEAKICTVLAFDPDYKWSYITNDRKYTHTECNAYQNAMDIESFERIYKKDLVLTKKQICEKFGVADFIYKEE